MGTSLSVWKLLALAAGWAEARDYDESGRGDRGRLIVYRDHVHFSGEDAWLWAGRLSLARLATAITELAVISAFLAAIMVLAAIASGRL